MKKRLIAFVSMLMAFVLCFALVACDGQTPTKTPTDPNDPNKPIKPEPTTTASMTVKQALNAVDKLLTGDDGWKGEASYKLSTANTDELTDAVKLDKRGNCVEIAIGEESIIFDMGTGYAYYKEMSGYYASQMMFGGAVDYARYLVSGQLTDELTAASFKYDKQTGAAHFELDLAEKINNALAPLYDAYKKDKTVKALLNDYCTQYLNMTFDDIYTAIKTAVVAYKDKTVDEVLLTLKGLGLDIIALLKENGVEVTEKEMEIYGSRKIKEMVAGAYVYIMEMMEETTAEGDEPELGEAEGGGMETVMAELMNAMFMEEYDDDTIDEAFNSIETMIGGMLEIKVKKTIDDLAAQLPPELYVMIQNGVKFEELKVEMNAVFDKDNNISELNVAAAFKHDYKGETDGLKVLADNNYNAEATLKIDEYTDAEPFDIEFAEGGVNLNSDVTYIVYNLDGKNVSVYFELGGQEFNVTDIKLYVGNLFDEEPEQVTNAYAVQFNAGTSCFEFSGEFVAKFWDENAKPGDAIMAVAYFGEDEDNYVSVTLVYMNDDIDQLMEFAQKVAETLTPPDSNAPDDEDYAA